MAKELFERDKVDSLFEAWGKQLASDLKDSLDKALKNGKGNVQNASMDFNIEILKGNDVGVSIFAVDKGTNVSYWKYIILGRKPGAKKIPADVVGKQWQNKLGIDARQVLAKMAVTMQAKKNGVRLGSKDRLRKSIKVHKKTLDYDKATKTLSFIIQNSIYKKGIKPKPFIDQVINDERINDLRDMLIPFMKDQFVLIINDIQ